MDHCPDGIPLGKGFHGELVSAANYSQPVPKRRGLDFFRSFVSRQKNKLHVISLHYKNGVSPQTACLFNRLKKVYLTTPLIQKKLITLLYETSIFSGYNFN
jgi:hypothetical protein